MEGTPKIEKVISPEEFFEKNVEIRHVSKEDFLNIVKGENPEMDDEEIIQMKGINFDKNGKVVILICKDVFPEQYMSYIDIHEKWEAYIARKEGFNLWDRTQRVYKKDHHIEIFDEESKKKFFNDLGIYNYEFRHEYAVYKEYQQAEKDGKLEEYHKWIMDLREEEKLTAMEKELKLIENDTEIRKSIFKKLKEGDVHVFLRN